MKQEKYKIELTEEEVAILKAGIEYFIEMEAFANALFRLVIWMKNDNGDRYIDEASSLRLMLDATCPVEPNFGYWKEIIELHKILDRHYKSEKRKLRAENRRQRMIEKK